MDTPPQIIPNINQHNLAKKTHRIQEKPCKVQRAKTSTSYTTIESNCNTLHSMHKMQTISAKQ